MVDAQILLQHYLSILVCEPIAQEFGGFVVHTNLMTFDYRPK